MNRVLEHFAHRLLDRLLMQIYDHIKRLECLRVGRWNELLLGSGFVVSWARGNSCISRLIFLVSHGIFRSFHRNFIECLEDVVDSRASTFSLLALAVRRDDGTS